MQMPFINHTISYVRIKQQGAINANETVKTKLTFEIKSQSQGVVIKGYHTDDEIFDASEFMEELLKKQQKIRFSGSGASHQMGQQSIQSRCKSLWKVQF